MSSPAQAVRTGVAEAARLRRGRMTARHLWRAAPIAAAVCAGLAAGVRWAGWPPLLPLAAGAATLVALAAYLVLSRRDRAITDATAAGLDEAASLGGELRSATWFAAADSRGDWADYHVARAAERLDAVDWTQLYPPVRAPRAKAATALLTIATLLLVFTAAGRAGLQARTPGKGAAAGRGVVLADGELLPPELRKQLEDLLKEAERAGLTGNATSLTASEVRDLLAKLTQIKELRDAKEGKNGPDADSKQMGLPAAKELNDLAERLKRAAEIPALSPDVREAMKDVAEKLSEMGEAQPSGPKDPQDAAGAANAPQGDAAQGKKDGDKNDDSSIQSVKDANSGGGAGVVMMSSEQPQGAQEAGLGFGGASQEKTGGGKMPDLSASLRKETVEAYKDDIGEKAEDLRRKTERATATVKFAATSPAAFEKGRATAPPAVPESRRAAVQTYFIRKQ